MQKSGSPGSHCARQLVVYADHVNYTTRFLHAEIERVLLFWSSRALWHTHRHAGCDLVLGIAGLSDYCQLLFRECHPSRTPESEVGPQPPVPPCVAVLQAEQASGPV